MDLLSPETPSVVYNSPSDVTVASSVEVRLGFYFLRAALLIVFGEEKLQFGLILHGVFS